MEELHIAMELAESDSEDEELDAVLCQIGAQLVRSDRNRTPRYYEEVVAHYFDYEYKRLFLLSRDTFETLVGRFKSSSFFPSVHDARVLKESPFYSAAELKCAGDYLLGDAVYPLLPWLMPPYKDNRATFERHKRKFNKRLSQQREPDTTETDETKSATEVVTQTPALIPPHTDTQAATVVESNEPEVQTAPKPERADTRRSTRTKTNK
ncbi:hypothetical protein HPB52_022795 [Rhipicephalus sanguineus]|uniref:DDE Tnp4 domain-containing protein n=1 Tax=Rhipicephalus sanguineus TaxID=34632 RepID=A0A9D4QEI7_RHISA|nr:hypothetical protein HPB52_022795 [Rhipicephalus sanguineus]